MELPFYDKTKGEFLRSGTTGDWKNYFSPDEEKHFDSFYQKNILETDAKIAQFD